MSLKLHISRDPCVPSVLKTVQAWQFIAVCFAAVFLFTSEKVKSADWEVQLHQGTTSKIQGYSFAVSDSVFRRSNLYWHASYTNINDIDYPWNNKNQYIPASTMDASLGYRFARRNFNGRVQGIAFELQLGAAVSLKESQFTFPEDENLPSTTLTEVGDIAPLLTASFTYSVSDFSAVTFGVKHLVDFAELGDITTVYLGFSYQLGNRQYGL